MHPFMHACSCCKMWAFLHTEVSFFSFLMCVNFLYICNMNLNVHACTLACTFSCMHATAIKLDVVSVLNFCFPLSFSVFCFKINMKVCVHDICIKKSQHACTHVCIISCMHAAVVKCPFSISLSVSFSTLQMQVYVHDICNMISQWACILACIFSCMHATAIKLLSSFNIKIGICVPKT